MRNTRLDPISDTITTGSPSRIGGAPCGVTVFLIAFGWALIAHAQQFATDDAATIGQGACQVEGWYGPDAAWLLPACSFTPDLEWTLGAGVVQDAGGSWRPEGVVQAKWVPRPLDAGGLGAGLVAGLGVSRPGQVRGLDLTSVYVYVPLGRAFFADRLVLHANAGWSYALTESDHALFWAVRVDTAPSPSARVLVIGEVYGGEDQPAAWQAGLRLVIVSDRLQADLSYGSFFHPGGQGAGFVFGLAWTPRPFF